MSWRYFRGEAGTGLRLAICQKSVQRYVGKINLASELRHGSTFMVWLPSVQAADTHSRP